MSTPIEIPNSGSFNCWAQAYDLPDLILTICRLGKTGELRFMSSEAEKTIIINEGAIIFAKSSSADDRLGPYLLREKRIRFEHMTDLSRYVTPERRFGAVLVDNGVLEPHGLVEGVVGQTRSIILSLFQWTEAAYIFEEKELAKETIELSIPLPKLVVEGVGQVTSWRRIARGVGQLDAVLQSADGIDDRVGAARLEPHQLELVEELRGPKTIAELCATSELADFEVCQLLWAYKTLGWLTTVTSEPVHVSTPTASEPEVSEVASVVATPLDDAELGALDDADLDGLDALNAEDPLARLT